MSDPISKSIRLSIFKSYNLSQEVNNFIPGYFVLGSNPTSTQQHHVFSLFPGKTDVGRQVPLFTHYWYSVSPPFISSSVSPRPFSDQRIHGDFVRTTCFSSNKGTSSTPVSCHSHIRNLGPNESNLGSNRQIIDSLKRLQSVPFSGFKRHGVKRIVILPLLLLKFWKTLFIQLNTLHESCHGIYIIHDTSDTCYLFTVEGEWGQTVNLNGIQSPVISRIKGPHIHFRFLDSGRHSLETPSKNCF